MVVTDTNRSFVVKGCLTTGMIMLAVGSTVVFGRPFEEVCVLMLYVCVGVDVVLCAGDEGVESRPSSCEYAVCAIT